MNQYYFTFSITILFFKVQYLQVHACAWISVMQRSYILKKPNFNKQPINYSDILK